MLVGDQVSLSISYNPDRVSVDMSTFVSSHKIVSLDDDGSLVSVVLRVIDPTVELLSV